MLFITRLTGSPARPYFAHMQPGKQAFSRITIAVRSEEEAEILELKHALEVKSGRRISISELFRQSIKCLREREGLA